MIDQNFLLNPRRLGRAFALFAGLGLTQLALGAVVILTPANNSKLRAGPDFATDVMGDPWDMNNVEDISPDPDERAGWSSFGFPGNGTVGGTTALNLGIYPDSSVTFLGKGYLGDNGVINPGRNGIRFPIESTIYKKVAMKMYSGVAGQLPKVTWWHNPRNEPGGTFGATFVSQETVVGYRIFQTANLTAIPDPASPYKAWQFKNIVGFQLGPNGTKAGHDAFFDWVRITRSDDDPQAAILPITWTMNSPTATIELIDESGAMLNIPGVKSPYNFNYGVLPPGTYTLRVNASTEGIAQVTFVINNPPIVSVVDPNETGGEDFAAAVLNNAWDMSGPEDVAVLSNSTGVSFRNGILTATDTNGDPAITLFNTNGSTLIDTSRYRYLTYRMKIDGPYDLAGGSIARVHWSTFFQATGPQTTTSTDIFAWSGLDPQINDFVSYTIDLGSLTIASGGLEKSGMAQPWLDAVGIRSFRIDPHEFVKHRTFHLDYVKLAAMREGRGSVVLTYNASDADDPAALAKLYYATDKTPASRVLIAERLPLGANRQYTWDLTGVPLGEYWIYAEASDGRDTRGLYSTGKIRILAPIIPGAATLDIDQNGRYDALTDGLLLIRYLFGLSGNALISGAIGAGAGRSLPADIRDHIAANRGVYDVDGNGVTDGLTDGLMMIRYLFGLRGSQLTNGAIGPGATRNTQQIQDYIATLRP